MYDGFLKKKKKLGSCILNARPRVYPQPENLLALSLYRHKVSLYSPTVLLMLGTSSR